jgi:hypothetical protein
MVVNNPHHDPRGVGKKECYAENSTVVHRPTSRRLTYAELVDAASKLSAVKTETIALKRPQDFRLIGKSNLSKRPTSCRFRHMPRWSQ